MVFVLKILSVTPQMKLSFVDVTKAYFNAVPTREVYVRVPKELGLPPALWANLFAVVTALGTPACCGKRPTQRSSQQPASFVAELLLAVFGIRNEAFRWFDTVTTLAHWEIWMT